MLKLNISRGGGVGIALLLAISSSAVFAQTQTLNYAFPSPMPPTGSLDGVKQIVSFIWDDNAYSGKNGSNYEGPKWMADPKFDNVGWVGNRREEAGHIFPTNNNDMNLKEGDFGMAWAAKVLAGYGQEQLITSYFLNPQFWAGYTYKLGDTLVAYSQKDGKLGVYLNAVSPYNGGFDKWPAGKTIDDLVIDNSVDVCVPTYYGSTETVCKPYNSLTESERNEYAKTSGRVFMKLDISPNGITKGEPKKNPDGSNITMTFNIITGQIIPAVNRLAGNIESSANRQSKWGYWIPNAAYSSTVFGGVAIAWGREYPIMLQSYDGNKNDKWGSGYWMSYDNQMQVTGYLNVAYQEAADLGHEIGNHTIDHLETNSMLPYKAGGGATAYPGFAKAPDNSKLLQSTAFKDGFGRWPDENGGYDFEEIDRVTLPDGEVLEVNEATSFGQKPGAPQQFMGWVSYAGKILSKEAWTGLIKIGEEEIHNYLDISKQGGKVTAFRAPRLEVNSNMFWSLRNEGYLYDCGNEEGYEYSMDGTNYLWPYTMDNGSPNVAWQRMANQNRSNFDSLPYGFWQYPVGVLIIPQEHRGSVFGKYAEIMTAEGSAPSNEDREHFLKWGKVTGFDFNLFIINGTTYQEALDALKLSLDRRMAGGKAPMQVGCHSDYFTPIYDNATLLNAANKSTYGLVVTKGWNTWRDRIKTFEDFRDYGLSKGAYFWDGKKGIEYVQSLVSAARVGSTETDITDIGQWTPFTHNDKSVLNGDVASAGGATITTTLSGGDYETAGYAVYGSAGEFEFDHISLEYATNAPLTIRLMVSGSSLDESFPYEVTLNNLKGSNFAESGQIPLSAFQRNQYIALENSGHTELTGLQVPGTDFAETVTGIEVAVQVPNGKSQTTKLAIRNFTLFSGEQTQGIKTGIAKGQKAKIQKTAVLAMTSNALKLNLTNTGVYNVDILMANGRVVKSFKSINLNAGLNTLSLNGLAKGMYMIRIHNKNFNTSLKSLVM